MNPDTDWDNKSKFTIYTDNDADMALTWVE